MANNGHVLFYDVKTNDLIREMEMPFSAIPRIGEFYMNIPRGEDDWQDNMYIVHNVATFVTDFDEVEKVVHLRKYNPVEFSEKLNKLKGTRDDI